ncbi:MULTISPECIES: preprotein translocase subunit YajC [Thioalkalivibrio]|uniref:Sec translocon accessory complex subunit YajC n=1 Tax=Thioalkalivibrio halophilus TaxID=252474 RepID=A0A1V2ZZP9_9GAMM|nr:MULTISPECIES: preprotein translocase subunit YajC [Thioalkalivibrio]OOC10582.1 preprotein translocase subunit YajC [Thioalkalivibrio halophilus]PYG00755.1 protein translocase subunit yajC [Thioalkalivibrio sp. ALE21]
MDFLISAAHAQEGQAAGGGLIEFLIMIVIFFAIMYFLIIRPQSKRAKEHRSMVESLSKGDEIVTNGGMAGKITEVGENFIHVDVADGVNVVVQKQSVQSVMPKGSLKDL